VEMASSDATPAMLFPGRYSQNSFIHNTVWPHGTSVPNLIVHS